MTISERIRKIREYRGFKQFAVANEMKVTQQSYSYLENKSTNIKIETLKRFADAVKVDLPFLLSLDLPVNDENMKMVDAQNYSVVIEDFKKLKSKLNLYQEILFGTQKG